MPRSAKTAAVSSGPTPPTKSKPETKVPVATTEAPESVTPPIPMVTDAELYGYPAYEYPGYGYNDDPHFEFPEELLDWGEEESDIEPPRGCGVPDDDDDDDQEEVSDNVAADTPVTHQIAEAAITAEETHLLLDYFAAHALNGLLAALPAAPEISFDAARTAHLAYECAEAMLRERHKRLAG